MTLREYFTGLLSTQDRAHGNQDNKRAAPHEREVTRRLARGDETEAQTSPMKQKSLEERLDEKTHPSGETRKMVTSDAFHTLPIHTLPADPERTRHEGSPTGGQEKGEETTFPNGERQIDDYVCVGRLGSGGMGTVYLAHDVHLKRRTVLKFLIDGKETRGSIGEEEMEQLRKEGEEMGRLRHTNLAIVHKFSPGDEETGPWFAMEYIEGVSLKEYMTHSLTNKDILGIVENVLKGMQAFHQDGLVHRDVKPGNIMIRPDGRPVIIDFGLAARAKELEGKGEIAGTLLYMSPEQARGEDVTPPSDVYAVGLIAYRLYTGKEAREGEGVDLLRSARDGAIPRVVERQESKEARAQEPNILKRLDDRYEAKTIEGFIAESLEPNRGMRFADAGIAVEYLVQRSKKRREWQQNRKTLFSRTVPAVGALSTIAAYAGLSFWMLRDAEDLLASGRAAQELGNRVEAVAAFERSAQRMGVFGAFLEGKRVVIGAAKLGLLEEAIELGDYAQARKLLPDVQAFMRKTATEERKDDTEDDTHKELYLRGLEAQANEQREIAIGSFERYVERTAQGGVIDLKAARILANLHLKAARQSTDKERQEEHIAKAREANQRVIRALAAEEQGRFPAARTSLLRATARVQEAWIYDLADRLGLAPDASGVSYGRLAQRDLDEAFTISKIQGNAHLGGIIRTTEAVMARQRNDLELASQKAREAVGILTGAQTAENDKGKREGGVGALAMALDTLAAIQTEQLKLAQAEESSVRALALYDELGNTRDSLQANYNYGTLLVQRGSIEKAERIFLKGIRAARAARDEYHEALFLSARGDIFAFREENGLAAASYLEALGRFADKRDFQQYYALTQGTLMLVRTGKVKEARALIIAPCEERFGCDQYNKGLLLEARAMLAAATGERAMLERAIEEIEKEGAAMSVQSAGVAARMYAAASRAALRLGDARRSQSYRAKAEETLRSDVSAFDRSAARATLHGK